MSTKKKLDKQRKKVAKLEKKLDKQRRRLAKLEQRAARGGAPKPRRLKKKCCRKYRKKGKYCKRCPVRAVRAVPRDQMASRKDRMAQRSSSGSSQP
jgi:hypothetical protein